MIRFIKVPGEGNIIYNKIIDPDTGRALYPDIRVPHNFTETTICDNKIYNDYARAVSELGTAHCFVISCNDEAILSAFHTSLLEAYKELDMTEPYDSLLFNSVCEALQLSVTMRNSFAGLMTYYSTLGNVNEYLVHIADQYELPAKDKRKGKQIYELIRKDIME